MATQSFFCPPAWECEFLVSARKTSYYRLFPASTCEDGCRYVRGRSQVRARTLARTCKDACRYVRGRLQVRASEKSKTGTGNFLMYEFRWF